MTSKIGLQDGKDGAGMVRPNGLTVPCEAIPYILGTIDALIILASGLLSGICYHWFFDLALPNLAVYAGVGLLASLIHIIRLGETGYYEFQNSAKPHVEFIEIAVSWVTTTLVLAFLAFLLKVGISFSRGAFVIFFFVTFIGLLAARKGMKAILQASLARGAIGRRNIVLIVSSAEFAVLGAGDLLALFGAAKVNRFTLNDENDDQSRKLSDMRVLDRVASFVKDQNTAEILLALPWNDEERLDCIREALKKLPVAVRLLGDSRVRSLTNFSSSGQSNVLSIDIQGPPLTLTEQMVKRLMDICISAFAIIFFSPVFLITAIAIKLDGPGPVIFRQYRKGFNGKQFLMYKFRTMTVLENGTDVPQARRNDPRITKIGRLLRATSIDELPQLLNVLRGEMSVIGPRPHALAHDTYFENALSEYAFRRHVKPGITGWAQCNGSRGATPSVDDVSARVKLDLWYINNWSLLLDVRILMKTFFEVLRRRNAY